MLIGIVHDAILDEHKEEMLKAVEKAISKEYRYKLIPFNDDFIKEVKSVDFVFNLSTAGGKDVRQLHVPSILDLLNIPYTGSSALTHAFCIDKSVTKMILIHNNIPTANFVVISPENDIPKDFNLKFPVIVKPSREGSALGLTQKSVAYDFEQLKEALSELFKNFKEPAVVEEFIDGTEITVGLIGNEEDLEVLPILEIDFSGLPEGVERFYSYRVKNVIDRYLKFHCPARISKDVWKKAENIAKKAFKILGLRDYARIDMRIKEDQPYILEVNSLPLLVPVYSDLTKMAKVAGMDYDELILRILKTAMKRYGLEG